MIDNKARQTNSKVKRFANKGLALASTLGLIVAFQNCSQESLVSSSNENENPAEVSVNLPGKSSESAKVDFVEVPNIQAASSEKISSSLSSEEEGEFRLVIAVESGALQILSHSNEVLDKGCLSQSDLQELKTILSGSSICKKSADAEDRICAQVYKPSYASLYANEKRISLGEERDSCGTGKIDLCGELSNVFKAYITHIKQNWEHMSCE